MNGPDSGAPKVSIFTPTYNRAYVLRRVFDSLRAQSHQPHEWVVVDDGSTDGTAELMQGFSKHADFPISYTRQVNLGKHAAFNQAMDLASGAFILTVDSDDWLVPNALEVLLAAWRSQSSRVQHDLAGVAGLCVDPSGEVIGTVFPRDGFVSDLVAIRAEHRVRGDKSEMVRLDVVRQHKFPVFRGERRVPTSHLWHKISLTHQMLFVNRVVTVKEYQADGLSSRLDRVRANNPLGSRHHYMHVVNESSMPVDLALRNCANYVRYSLHAQVSARRLVDGAEPKKLLLASAPLGLALYLRDKLNQVVRR